MKRWLLSVALLLAGIACIAHAQVPMTGAGLGKPASSGNCSPGTHASTFLARTSLSSGTTLYNAYCNLINGLDTDSTYSSFALLYVFATDTAADAELNLVSTSFTLGMVNTCTFNANQGFTCDGTSSYLTTGYNPNAFGGMTQNSAHIGACVLSSRTVIHNYVEIGSANAAFSYIQPLEAGTTTGSFDLNSTAFPSTTVTNAQGNWTVTRTSSAGTNIYNNGTLVNGPTTDTSGALTSSNYTVAAFNNAGTIQDFSADQLGAAYAGSGLTSTQVSNIASRLHTFLVSVGAPSGC